MDTPLKAWSLCSIYLDEVVWTLAGTVHWFTVSELCVAAAGEWISTTLVNHRKQSNDQWSVEVLNTNIRNILLNHWLVRELSTHSEKYHDIIIIILVSVGAFSDYLSQYWCKKIHINQCCYLRCCYNETPYFGGDHNSFFMHLTHRVVALWWEVQGTQNKFASAHI